MKYQNEIWLADLEPQFGTEAGKVRPVVIIQTDDLNEIAHPSTIICPITTNLQNSQILRLRLSADINGLSAESDVLVDQIRTIDNDRFIKRIGMLNEIQATKLKRNLKIVLDL